MLEDRRMIPSFSNLLNSALAAANFAASRWRKRAVAGGPVVLMWCSVLCLTGRRELLELATSWNSLKTPLKRGGVDSTAEKSPPRVCAATAVARPRTAPRYL